MLETGHLILIGANVLQGSIPVLTAIGSQELLMGFPESLSILDIALSALKYSVDSNRLRLSFDRQ